jgi:hypothetical protein
MNKNRAVIFLVIIYCLKMNPLLGLSDKQWKNRETITTSSIKHALPSCFIKLYKLLFPKKHHIHNTTFHRAQATIPYQSNDIEVEKIIIIPEAYNNLPYQIITAKNYRQKNK